VKPRFRPGWHRQPWLALLLLAWPVAADSVHVAVAANFRHTLSTGLSEAFHESTGHTLRISSASTGVLYSQVLQGAPFQVFLAADAERPRLLEAQGLAVSGSRFTYALGELVLVSRPVPASPGDGELVALLGRGGIDLVIANPDLAPYGAAAWQVLQRAGAPGDGARLLRAPNISQAYLMWHSGGADVALVARSQVTAGYLPVPAEWYTAPRQQAVLLNGAREDPAALSFMTFLRSDKARRVIEEAGYRTGSSDDG
jgi:molybdate transport system substrate-binding protein